MDSNPFELPKASEKLSYKFILDSLKEQSLDAEEALVETLPTVHEPSAEPVELAAPPEELENEPVAPETLPISPLQLEPGKKYFRIGEVSELIGVEPYVLRYWESEFSTIKPVKSGSGHRVYTRKDVETLHLVRHLLHVEKFSIKGAKKKLQERRKQAYQVPDTSAKTLRELSQGLKELIQLIRANPGTT